jgi:hypothetical protein
LDTGNLADHEPLDLSGFEVAPAEDQTAIIYSITEQGIIDLAVLIAPAENLRVLYAAIGYTDQGAAMPFPQDGWVDAP